MTTCPPSHVVTGTCVGDPRHKKQYPEGPRREMTDAWKRLVLAKLAENAAEDPPIEPSDKASLARLLHVDKSGLGRTLLPNHHPRSHRTSGLVDPICEILGIPAPTIAVTPDDDELLGLVQALEPHQKRAVLDLIRTMSGKRPRPTK